jgi:hypothetical protein
MQALIVWLAALLPLLSPQVAGKGEASSWTLERSSLAVTDGTSGTIFSSVPLARLAAHFDRVERAFQVVRRRPGPQGEEYWIGELEPEQFRALLDLAVATGLPELPLESPPSCGDVYGRSCQIRLDYGKVQWANGRQDGCVGEQSNVVPTEEDLCRFGEIIERLEQAVDALPMRHGTLEDLKRVPFLPDLQALQSYRRVMQHVRYDPRRHELDLERVCAFGNRVTFTWRGRGLWGLGEDVVYTVDPSGIVTLARPMTPPEDFEPVTTGMTLAQVLARLGDPDALEARGDGVFILIYRTPADPEACVPPSAIPGRLRFENGLLSAP